MKVDQKFTDQVQRWIQMPERTEEDIISGATLLLRIMPGYRLLFTLTQRTPRKMEGKIEYELRKHLRYRLDGLTRQEVAQLDRRVMSDTGKIIDALDDVPDEDLGFSVKKGRRPDHDRLPAHIRKLWDDNGELYKDIKALFEELKSMHDRLPCDRYDKLQLLASMDRRYHEQMERYDAAHPDDTTEGDDDTSDDDTTEEEGAASVSSKEVKNARSYISKKVRYLESMSGTETDAVADLRLRLRERVEFLLKHKIKIGEELLTRLRASGVI